MNSLFDDLPPAQRHSDTSVAAADAIAGTTGRLRRLVLDHLKAVHPAGATDEEMQTALGMNPSTQRPRRIELVERHMVRDSGQRRKTTSGRWAVVWEVTA